MNKKVTAYGLIFGLLLIAAGNAFAGTDILSNVLTQSNSFLKEAGLVQKKYSGIARKLVTTKVSIDLDKLGGEKIQKLRQKAESIKEKAAQLQDRIETAKERADELKAKYEELNAKAMEYKAKADEYIAAGQEIKAYYQNFKEEAVNTLEDIKEAKNTVEDKINRAKDVLDKEDSEVLETVTADVAEGEYMVSETTTSSGMENNQRVVNEAEAMVSNRAEAIRSAAILAEDVVADNITAIPQTSILSKTMPQVSASSVITAVQTSSENVSRIETPLPSSRFDLQEQLLQASTSSDKEGDKNISAKAKLVDGVSATAERQKFTAGEVVAKTEARAATTAPAARATVAKTEAKAATTAPAARAAVAKTEARAATTAPAARAAVAKTEAKAATTASTQRTMREKAHAQDL